MLLGRPRLIFILGEQLRYCPKDMNVMKRILKYVLSMLALMTVFPLLMVVWLLAASYDSHRPGITFYVRENHEWGNGRTLEIYHQDSAAMVFPEWAVCGAGPCNMYCQDSMEARVDSFYMRVGVCPVVVHRYSGRTDTVYTQFKSDTDVGYVSRDACTEDWIVAECKLPGEILGHKGLTDYAIAAYGADTLPVQRLRIDSYTFIGQEIVFDSDIVHYWIASRKTPDIYGPFTEREAVCQMEKLGIPLPITLDGNYDRYVYNCSDEKRPDSFSWPNWRHRPDKTLGECCGAK